MKLNVEIEIDFLEEDGSISEEIKHRLIEGLADKLEMKFLDGAGKKMTAAAEKLITAKTELLINTILEKPVHISNGWNDKQDYDSIYDMVESKMANLYGEKFDNSGKCTKDPLLANIEKYVSGEVERHTVKIEKAVERHSRISAKEAVEQNEFVRKITSVLDAGEEQ